MEEHPLQHAWTAWVHKKGGSTAGDYGSAMSKVTTFNTAEGFWRFMNFTPCPSELFATDITIPKFSKDIEGISLFKSGVRPEWEDPKNLNGGELFLRKTLTASQLDQIWEDVCLGAVGETIDPTDVITGVRIVDKFSKGKVVYRLEVWFEVNQENDPQMVETIKENLIQAMGNLHNKVEYKAHGGSGESQPHGGGHGGGGGNNGRFFNRRN